MTSTCSAVQAPLGDPAQRARQAVGRDGARSRWRPAARLPALVLLGLPVLVIGVAGVQRRWMADDGHIYLRTVRQVLAGHGPVLNPGERVESATGTLWQWLLVLAGLSGADLATAAVYGGLLLTVLGFALATLGAVRLHGGAGGPRPAPVLVPLGSLLLVALPPVWDFATSGLETGLATCWIAGAWLRLVARPRTAATSMLLGLGPLVRPELALVSAVLLAAQWVCARPPLRTAAGALAAALALPVGYEVFRAGYYGHLVPLPAVAKEASVSLWDRGFGYLADFAGPYLLWLPALAVAAAAAAWRLPGNVRGHAAATPRTVRRAEALAPVLAGLLCWLYVLKVGGDFMHGRMLLPGLLLMLLPVFAVPAGRVQVCAVAAVAVWAVACAGWLRVGYEGRVGPAGIADERGVYVRQNASAHPVHHRFTAAPWLRRYARTVREAGRDGTPALVLDGARLPGRGASVTGVHLMLGFNGTVVPLTGAALDPIGLGYPLAAHTAREAGARVGHDKHLPRAWILADRGAPAALPPGATDADRTQVAAARRALRCGPLADLTSATRAPLTPARFWRNLNGAWHRSTFRFPSDPARAERRLCAGRNVHPTTRAHALPHARAHALPHARAHGLPHTRAHGPKAP